MDVLLALFGQTVEKASLYGDMLTKKYYQGS